MTTDAEGTAFSDFFHREFEPVARTAYVVLQNQQWAEDVAQDAFGQLYLNWTRISGYDNPQAWVRRVAIRIAVRLARREETRRVLTRGQASHPPPPGRDLDLAAALRTLPAQQRAAVALHYYEDRPAEEIGELLGCSASTVRTHLSRARARLAELLAEEEADHVE
ncbi:putative RNA polymerase sigma factor [metagenome]|uniref:Putative RNA polymerase sigma factor n=1 Tax=metagenome TaxID=256318 RepID=A0A2P2CFG0_9ZZZZ